MSFTFLAKSLAYSWKMSLAGQVLWKRRLTVCALLTMGAAMAAAPTAPAEACFRKLRRGAPDWRGEVIERTPWRGWTKKDSEALNRT
jgi:hypothetical protein